MDLDKILDSFELLCLRIIIDLILLPKTIARLYKDHTFPYQCSVSIWNNPDTDTNYTSPVKLTLYTIILICLLPGELGGFAVFQAQRFESMGVLEKAILLFMIFNAVPILLTTVVLRLGRQGITAQSVRVPLYSFIYSFSYLYFPLFICFIPAAIIDKVESHPRLYGYLSQSPIYTCIIIGIGILYGILLFCSLIQCCRATHHSVGRCLTAQGAAAIFLLATAMVLLYLGGITALCLYLT